MVTKTFDRLRKEIENKDKTREELIVGSRPIIKDSKQAIYAIHRGSVAEAEKLIQKASRGLDELRRLPDQKSRIC